MSVRFILRANAANVCWVYTQWMSVGFILKVILAKVCQVYPQGNLGKCLSGLSSGLTQQMSVGFILRANSANVCRVYPQGNLGKGLSGLYLGLPWQTSDMFIAFWRDVNLRYINNKKLSNYSLKPKGYKCIRKIVDYLMMEMLNNQKLYVPNLRALHESVWP